MKGVDLDNMKPLSRKFLEKQEECCGGGCRNCPYQPKHTKGTKIIMNPRDETTDIAIVGVERDEV